MTKQISYSKGKSTTWKSLFENSIPTKFIDIIKKHFKEIKQEGNHCTIKESDYKIYYFSNPSQKKSKCLAVDIYGENGLYQFIELAKEEGWQIFDKSLNTKINLNFPKKYTYQEYKEMILHTKPNQ